MAVCPIRHFHALLFIEWQSTDSCYKVFVSYVNTVTVASVLPLKNMRRKITSTACFTVVRNGVDVELYIKGSGYVDSGYPAEGEIEIDTIETEDGPYNDDLSNTEFFEVIELLWENYEQVEDDDYEPEYYYGVD